MIFFLPTENKRPRNSHQGFHLKPVLFVLQDGFVTCSVRSCPVLSCKKQRNGTQSCCPVCEGKNCKISKKSSEVFNYFFYKFLTVIQTIVTCGKTKLGCTQYKVKRSSTYTYKAPCKLAQHQTFCWPLTPYIVGCYILLSFLLPGACCCVLLGDVAQILRPVKHLANADGRNNSHDCSASNVGSCCVPLHVA